MVRENKAMKNIMIFLTVILLAGVLFITARLFLKDDSDVKHSTEEPVDIRKIDFSEYPDVNLLTFEASNFVSYRGNKNLTFQKVLDSGVKLNSKDLDISQEISGLGTSANDNGQVLSSTVEDSVLMYRNLNEVEGLEVLDEICFSMLNVDGKEIKYEIPECYF